MIRLLSSALVWATVCTLTFTPIVLADDQESAPVNLLVDRTGDGVVVLQGFGDSITYGVGDGGSNNSNVLPQTNGSLGYLQRVRATGGIQTRNSGSPGENFVQVGIFRLPSAVSNSNADIVAILEGINDVFSGFSGSLYEERMQRALNVVRALGRQPLMLTVLPATGNHSGLSAASAAMSSINRSLAAKNSDVPLVDIRRAWENYCPNISSCGLVNLPEGLHPNTRGYDLIGQTVLGTLYGVDLFNPEAAGAAQLETILNLPAGTIIVKPNAAAAS